MVNVLLMVAVVLTSAWKSNLNIAIESKTVLFYSRYITDCVTIFYHLLDTLVVVDNGKCVAVGKSVPLTSVHGQIVPDTHKCILLTWAQDNYLAPFPCGNRDLKENLYFSKDSFYAVPRTMLRQLIRKNNQYSLSPIS